MYFIKIVDMPADDVTWLDRPILVASPTRRFYNGCQYNDCAFRIGNLMRAT